MTDNLDVAPSDFQSYCVTAPRDPRLPDDGGQQICGLYDIVPAKFGVATGRTRFNQCDAFVDTPAETAANLGRQLSVGATSNAGEPPASLITTFGSAWLRPLNVLQARYIKFGAQLNF